MPFNPNNDRHMKRLQDAVEQSRKALDPFIKNWKDAVEQFAGSWYSDVVPMGGEVPVNMIELAVNIYLRQLVARSPRASITTPHPEYRHWAAKLDLDVNHKIDAIGLKETLRHAAQDAMFVMGMVVMGKERYGDVFVDNVLLEDLVFDSGADDWRKMSFIGHRYREPLEYVRGNKFYDKNVRARLTGRSVDAVHNSEERIRTLSGEPIMPDADLKRSVELYQIFLPHEQLLLIVPSDTEMGLDPLEVIEWDGPEHGPYHRLRYIDVPGQIMPLGPAMVWMEQHLLMNRIFTKLSDQSDSQKNVGMYSGAGGAEDAQRISGAANNEWVKVNNPANVNVTQFPGVDQQNLGFGVIVEKMFKDHAGNLDILGGLSPVHETATTNQLIADTASKRLADMQDMMVDFVQGIVRDMAWYSHYDETESVLQETVEGTDFQLSVRKRPEEREGTHLDYNFDIVPYSMTHKTPGERLQAITAVWQQYIAPFVGTGIFDDAAVFEGMMREVAKHTDMPELNEILQFAENPSEDLGPVGEAPRKMGRAPVTHRINERVNRPGATNQGKEAAMADMLFGGNKQPAEKSAILRPAS